MKKVNERIILNAANERQEKCTTRSCVGTVVCDAGRGAEMWAAVKWWVFVFLLFFLASCENASHAD